MTLTYGIIRGSEALDRYCLKRWGETPRFMETHAHIANVRIELHYYHAPTDNGYYPYYILIMEHENGKFHHTSDIVREARELIETGRAHIINA